jgi:transglutaminase-like putative cysteine protease
MPIGERSDRADIARPAPDDGNLKATAILDHDSPAVRELSDTIARESDGALSYLRAAHQFLRQHVRPIYTVDELQPTSVTLARGKGSCSQRFACLEALARCKGIATQVQALWIAGRFWYPRFGLTKWFIPREILLAWPAFRVDGQWVTAESLFGSIEELAERSPSGFTNTGESIFDAVSHTAIDFHGQTAQCAGGVCNLAPFLARTGEIFPTRDELFAAYPLLQNTWRGRAFEMLYGGRKSA